MHTNRAQFGERSSPTGECSPGRDIQKLVLLIAPAKSGQPWNHNNMERVAVRVVLLYVAEIVAEVETRTADVLTVNVALVAPAGTVTLAGTLAAPLLLESKTCAPPAGAGALSVTVPVDDCMPPTTLPGFSVSEATVGSGGGGFVTVSVAVRLTLA